MLKFLSNFESKTFLRNIFLIFLMILGFNSCAAFKFQKVDTSVPISGEERARKNIEEGRGLTLGSLRNSKTTYEFSTSNPMWRAALDTLDFMPLSNIDYSGGVIVTDWYNSAQDKNNSVKITVRFLSNEISAANIKIIVHEKKCEKNNNNCAIKEINSLLKNEIREKILRIAAQLDTNKPIKK